MPKIVVIGLAGCLPLALALARKFDVIGFDVHPERVSELRAGYNRTGEAPLKQSLLHVMWPSLVYIYAERRIRQRYAVVPFGNTDRLLAIDHRLAPALMSAASRRSWQHGHRRRPFRRSSERMGGISCACCPRGSSPTR